MVQWLTLLHNFILLSLNSGSAQVQILLMAGREIHDGESFQSSSRGVLFALKGLVRAAEQMTGELYKSEVLLVASTLLIVKTENIYWNTIKMHKTMENDESFKDETCLLLL